MAQRKHIYPVGLVIRKYRKNAKLTQGRLASRLGVSTNYISRIELGKEHLSIDNFIKFAKSLKANPGELLNTVIEEKENYSDIIDE